MSNKQNDIFNEAEMEASMEHFDKCIKKINEHTARIKELDKKLEAKRQMLREAKSISMSDIGLLPLTW